MKCSLLQTNMLEMIEDHPCEGKSNDQDSAVRNKQRPALSVFHSTYSTYIIFNDTTEAYYSRYLYVSNIFALHNVEVNRTARCLSCPNYLHPLCVRR